MFRIVRVLISIVVLVSLITACGEGQSSSTGGNNSENKTMTLKLVSVFPKNHSYTRDVVPMWIDMVENEISNINIEWIGSGETIPIEEQFSAVQTGVADIGFNVAAYYGNEVPAGETASLSPYTPSEERDNGYFDFLSERYEEAGVVYLGRWLSAFPFYIWSNVEIKTIEDFKGLAIRSNPLYHQSLEALGASPVAVLPSEVYTSLERGMVDGFGFPILGPREDGWTEVTKYLIDEPFFNQQAAIYINPKTLSSLPEEDQKTIKKVTANFEKEMAKYFQEEVKKESNKLDEAGVEKIKLDQEDSKQFQDIVYEAKWEEVKKNIPNHIDKVKELLDY